jgi:hypothetical protein
MPELYNGLPNQYKMGNPIQYILSRYLNNLL